MMETDIQNSETLDDIWDMMGSWLGRLKETKEVAACLQYVTEFFWNLMKTTESFPKPSVQRCSGIIFIINQVLAMFGKLLPTSVPFLETLSVELYNVIYLRPRQRSPLPQLVFNTEAVNLRTPESVALTPTPSFSLSSTEDGKAAAYALRDKKTFFQSTSMLAQRLTGTKQTTDAIFVQREKEQLVLERVISVWQQQLVARLFCGWRDVRARRLRETKEKEQIDNTTQRLLQLEDSLQQSRMQERHYQRLANEAERSLLEQELVMKTLADKQTSQINSLKKKLAECEATLATTRSESTRAVLELENRAEEVQRVLRQLTSIDFETSQRLKVANIIGSNSLTELQKLSTWVQTLIQEHPLYTPMYKFEGFQQGTRLLDIFYLLLSSMSPFHVSPSDCAKHIQLPEPGNKAVSLLQACDTLGIAPNLEVHELAGTGVEEQEELPQTYQLFVSCLFHRFCNGDGQTVQFRSAAGDEELNKFTDEKEALSIQDWKGRIETKQALTGKWRNIAHSIQLKTWLGLKKKEISMNDEGKDFLQFTTIDKDRISGLFTAVSPGLTAAVVAEHVVEVQSVLEKSFRSLRGVYYSYTSKRYETKKSDWKLTSEEFWRQITDCKISGKNYTRQQIASAFEKANRDSDDYLDPSEWTEALIYIASGLKQGEHLKDKFQILINDYILVNSSFVLTNEFKNKLYGDPKIASFLFESRSLLSECFSIYCDKNKKDKRTDAAKELDLTEFCVMLGDIPQFDPPPQDVIRDMYGRILSELAGAAQGMLLHEFTEAICAVACYKDPDPFISTFSKIETFFETYLSHLKAKSRPQKKKSRT
eukprot:TRINITY_DN3016_c0_g1_i1.p1 TRINITY_DN3016_c0_g1~~TRINITY_DN3016_c0_g1_i1.p1  ORF type:complete len:821 (+),score=173.68 TRINITY_DN3016_c0_g1_i1:595-3057(+)